MTVLSVLDGASVHCMGVGCSAAADGPRNETWMGWWRELSAPLHALAGGRVVAPGQRVGPLGAGERSAGDGAGVPRP